MKNIKYNPLTLASLIVMVGVSQVNGAVITQTVDNIDWNAAMWGSPEGAPSSGNHYVSALGGTDRFRISASGASSTFGGDSLEVVTGTRALMKNSNNTTATVNGDFILNGGRLSLGANSSSSATLEATRFIVNSSSVIDMANSGVRLTIDSVLSGSGGLDIHYETGSDGASRAVAFTQTAGYTGIMNVNDSMVLDFDSDVIFGGTLNINGTSELIVDQVLTFGSGSLVADGNSIAVGTYTGTDLDALGLNFINNGGTVIVTSAIPEPSTSALVSICALGLLLRRRRA
ncbi:PEP-CTERM protein-sorting domain-containing protein [Rubritalea squalenifaciens DSM 18772]|uniref:PEP-CTERM protein-sorting domain-containing protein n=1 Tax=Rubritalea squalenifaciens DSM 18772 TaxID=1123071 RepID=A0A1M6IVR2_9BACT|nr:PEP-CTERM sorting domain-containing protein [Rubritalea squalenifaciens]SHJ38545.1 PEP-CTERM protein-sorting domain-containing protein [Rubritalea squalenifaciens DSM 18772]